MVVPSKPARPAWIGELGLRGAPRLARTATATVARLPRVLQETAPSRLTRFGLRPRRPAPQSFWRCYRVKQLGERLP